MSALNDLVRSGKVRYIGASAMCACAWLRQKDGVTAPIIGATKISHLEDAVASLSVKLTDEEIACLEEPYIPHRVVGADIERNNKRSKTRRA
jgi:aryl-alcohol dehydrogenase-like predicted oxidoreductase